MRCYLVLLVFIPGTVASMAIGSVHHTTDKDRYRQANHGRILKPTDTEERGLWPNIKSWFKSTYWAYSGTTQAEVKTKLGLTGLTEAAMKTNPKHRTYKHFLYKVEGLQLDDLVLRKVYTPSSFWRILKLDQLSNQYRTSELKLFKRFLTRYERQVYRGHNRYNEHFGTVEAQKILYVK
ncbi:RxLR effector protein, partial [Phytophthora megakarya]